jgi:hypothetical protein
MLVDQQLAYFGDGLGSVLVKPVLCKCQCSFLRITTDRFISIVYLQLVHPTTLILR